jgi:hypothetical protein
MAGLLALAEDSPLADLLGDDPCNPPAFVCVAAPCPQPQRPSWCDDKISDLPDLTKDLATTTFCRTSDGRMVFSPSPECAPLAPMTSPGDLARMRAEAMAHGSLLDLLGVDSLPYGKNTCRTHGGIQFPCGTSAPCVTADGRRGHTTDYLGQVCEADPPEALPQLPALKPAGVVLLGVAAGLAWWMWR